MTWFTNKAALSVLGIVLSLSAMGGTGYAVKHPLPPGTTVTVELGGSNHVINFAVTVGGRRQTVTCTMFSASGTVPESPGATLRISPPVISNCSDSTGPRVTLSTNSTHGSWKLSDSSGPTIDLVIPKKGLTPGGKAPDVLAAPGGDATVSGAYNSKDKDTIISQSVPVTCMGCTASDLSVTVTLTITPKPARYPRGDAVTNNP
ncbi:MAG: hypothetical protein ACLP6E_01735 [Acidimicrobiales bacterium]